MLSKEQQKAIALRRLEQLGLKKSGLDTYDVFKNDGLVYYSEHSPLGGILFTLPDNIQAQVDLFEKRREALIYHVVMTPTKFGKLWSFLYIGTDESDMEYEEECMEFDLKNIREGKQDFNQMMAYVYNEDEPVLSLVISM